MMLHFTNNDKRKVIKRAIKILTIVLTSLGTITLFFSKETSLVIYVFSFISLITGLLINHKSDQDSKRKDELIDMISQILSTNGLPSPLIERVKIDIRANKVLTKAHFKDIEKAYYLNKNDLEAAKLFLSIKTILFIHYKVYHKIIVNKYEYLNSLENELLKAISNWPKLSTFYLCLGIVNDYKGRFNKARGYYDVAKELGATPFILNLFSTSYLMSGNYVEALYTARLALKNKEYSWLTYFNLGRVHSEFGNYKTSIKYFEISRAIVGNQYELIARLSEIYMYQERFYNL